MAKTTIEWADKTRNYYTWDCTKVSPGCKNCYMMTLAARRNKPQIGNPQWRANVFKEKIAPGDVLFVNSMSDTYHESVPVKWIHAIHNDALAHPEATFLILTKRPERALGLSPYLAYPPNLWVGVSVENEDYLWRLDYLLQIPAAGHFVSIEPQLGPLTDLRYYLKPRLTVRGGTSQRRALGWVINGAESGKDRRPFYKVWAQEIRDMCVDAGVPYLFKQGSGFMSGQDRLLGGREWNESPFVLSKHSAEALTPNPSPSGRGEIAGAGELVQMRMW